MATKISAEAATEVAFEYLKKYCETLPKYHIEEVDVIDEGWFVEVSYGPKNWDTFLLMFAKQRWYKQIKISTKGEILSVNTIPFSYKYTLTNDDTQTNNSVADDLEKAAAK